MEVKYFYSRKYHRLQLLMQQLVQEGWFPLTYIEYDYVVNKFAVKMGRRNDGSDYHINS